MSTHTTFKATAQGKAQTLTRKLERTTKYAPYPAKQHVALQTRFVI